MRTSHISLIIWVVRFFAAVPLLWMLYFLHFSEAGVGGTPEATYNAVLFLSWCALHSLTARDLGKAFLSRLVGSGGVRALYVVVSGATLAALLYCWRPIAGLLWTTGGTLYWLLTLGYIVTIIATFYTTRYIDMGEFLGIRTRLRALKNKPPKSPVFCVEGPYSYCRHPMYLLCIAILWIGPTMSYGRLEFALLGTAYFLVGTFLEERNLRAELGQVYDVYRENVPMWIPRLTPWRSASRGSEPNQSV
jgi:methanethiol S-methyltransferase